MKPCVVLIMHGITPKDFPVKEKREYMGLRAKCDAHPPTGTVDERLRYQELERMVRNWPRTAANDPFQAAAGKIARELQKVSGLEVYVGFNEFCAPSADQALEAAAGSGPDQIIVTTPMMTPGGHHSEEEIPELISEARQRHPKIQFIYAWPFDHAAIAEFLFQGIRPFYK